MNLKESITIFILFMALVVFTLSAVKSKTISKDLINIVEILFLGFSMILLTLLYHIN